MKPHVLETTYAQWVTEWTTSGGGKVTRSRTKSPVFSMTATPAVITLKG